MDSEQKCSFSLKLKLAAYSDYLKKITEDPGLYSQRREAFLNHLLSRFAEKFTDFAMLSFGFLDEKALTKKEIADKENFLSNYDELSSNRGKGYDYRENGWKVGMYRASKKDLPQWRASVIRRKKHFVISWLKNTKHSMSAK